MIKKLPFSFVTLVALIVFETAITAQSNTEDSQRVSLSSNTSTSKPSSQVAVKQPAQTNSPSNAQQPPNTQTFPWGIILFTGVSASIITICLNRLFSFWDNKKKGRALVTAFGYELVLAYHRCVIYYLQSLGPRSEISYSRLFDYTDISSLATYATTRPKPDIVASIACLKAIYFQIVNHVDEAARLAAELRSEPNSLKRPGLAEKAKGARNTALAFFLAQYHPKLHEDIQNRTLAIINEVPSDIQEHLCRIFDKAKEVKSVLDSLNDKGEWSPEIEKKLEQLERELNDCLIQTNRHGVDQDSDQIPKEN